MEVRCARAMCIILKKARRTHIRWMLDGVGFPLNQTTSEFQYTYLFIFKIKNNLVPEYMNEEISYNRDATITTLRNKDDFRLPTYKKTYTDTQNSMWYDGLKLFNELTWAMKEECSNLEQTRSLKILVFIIYVNIYKIR
jgi:hypothetical protein